MGTGTLPSNTPKPSSLIESFGACPDLGSSEAIGSTTPHSQFRQFSLGFFVVFSWTSRPLFVTRGDQLDEHTPGKEISFRLRARGRHIPCAL